MAELIDIYEKVAKVMCSRCKPETRIRCTTAQHWGAHRRQMCICIENVLVPDDQNYPVKLKGE